MAKIGEDRWLRSMSSFSESDLVSMFTLALMELTYRHRTTPQLMADRFHIPEPFTLTIDGPSGVEKLTLNDVGRAWQWMTGRTGSLVASSACSSHSKVSSINSGASRRR